MSTMLVNPAAQAPARKPLPSYMRQPSAASDYSTQQAQIQQQQSGQYGGTAQRGHTRNASIGSHTTQSTDYSTMSAQHQQHPQKQPQQSQQSSQQQQHRQRPVQPPYGGSGQQPTTRRTLSNATSSTSSTSTSAGLSRGPTGTNVRRSTSSRSTSSASPTSYVALMRKQKGTVWCDRAQAEDPRILAAQRQAKMRAAMEVAGGVHHNPPSARANAVTSGGVRSKIRHHGAVKTQSYQAGPNLSGAGVPMRLSASEVDEGDSDDEPEIRYTQRFHQRNGSERSSSGSGKRVQSGYMNQQQQQNRSGGGNYSNGSTPPSNHSPNDSMRNGLEDQTPVPRGPEGDDYFANAGGHGGSAGSVQREDHFGTISQLPVRSRDPPHRDTAEDLIRRGSVDERTMTMSGVRLFVANPDLDD